MGCGCSINLVVYLHWFLGRIVLLGECVVTSCLTAIWSLLRWRVSVVRVHVVSVIGMRHSFYQISVD